MENHSPSKNSGKTLIDVNKIIKKEDSEFNELNQISSDEYLTKILHEDTTSIIELPQFDEPLVSIIIPVYNQWEYTYRCIKSIYENTPDIPYEVIVADDVSTDKTKNIKNIIKNAFAIRNQKNLKFVLNCNKAAGHARGKFIHF